MFTVRFHPCFVRPLRCSQQASGSAGQSFALGGILRGVAVLGWLALGLPQTSSAQALGTMQVTARVAAASVAWTGVAAAGEVARTAAREQYGWPLVRRSGLVHARAEICASEGRRLLVVTILHPHNWSPVLLCSGRGHPWRHIMETTSGSLSIPAFARITHLASPAGRCSPDYRARPGAL